MASIWKQQKDVNEHPNRNNFDLSKKSNISMKFGTLYPVYCQPVVPGDSFSIDTAFNLKLMPVIFPVQTKMRAHMHYFYVRNKNIWSNWENWISNLVGQSEHPHPYISTLDSNIKTGSIHDFLGVPTTVVHDSDIEFNLVAPSQNLAGSQFRFTFAGFESKENLESIVGYDESSFSCTSNHFTESYQWIVFNPFQSTSANYKGILEMMKLNNVIKFDSIDAYETAGNWDTEEPYMLLTLYKSSYPTTSYHHLAFVKLTPDYENKTFSFNLPQESLDILDEYKENGYQLQLRLCLRYSECDIDESGDTWPATAKAIMPHYTIQFIGKEFADYSELGANLYSHHLHINALPYRAYESIYYTYYNNNVLNPLKIDNVAQYNRYNTALGDGADTTGYHLFQRNYELDFLTSSLPSPQQGVAPVVGMTALGDVTIEDENGITTAHAEIDNDGTITKVILTSPAASIDHARTAMNIAACGMSISDFRQTNALTRFLETNIRKGYRYMDFIAGHFGKEPEYRELDLPEFIGGFSRDVSVSTVVSNADTLGDNSGKALGAYGGFAQVVGGGNSSIRHYCDDYGFIIGILSVVPTPCYSQLMPKYMVAPDNFLDYYFPEFSSSGLQPITYKEVAPIQSYLDSILDSSKSLEDTFGYQRPNYDMVSAVDEVHGEFRGSLRNYVINRIFDTRPELGQSFISINPSEINDIFVNTNPDDDCIIGEIGFAVHAKRPIPRVVIPNLGK